MKRLNTFILTICLVGSLMLWNTARSQNAGTAGTNATAQTADVPRILSYQGLVRGLDGRSVPDGRHAFIVNLYSDNAGSNLIWSDTYDVVTDQGIFNIMLGAGQNALPAGAQLNQPLWVGVRLDGQEEMRPLSQLVASAYALNVADKSITSEKLQDAAVTQEKMGTNYLGGIAVNGEMVTTKGSVLNLVGSGNTSLLFDKPTNSIIVSAAGATIKGGKSDTSANNGWTKNGSGAKTLANGSPVIEGSTGGTANYITEWQTVGGNPAANSLIVNTSILDNGTNVILNTAQGGNTAEITIGEATGNMTWRDANPLVLSMNAPASGDADSITIKGAPAPASTNNNGGHVVLKSGSATGTGNAGDVHLRSGSAAAGHGGNVIVDAPDGLFTVTSKNFILNGNGNIETYGAVRGKVVSATTNPYNVNDSDFIMVYSVNGINSTFNLPAANASHTSGRILIVERTGTGNVILTPNGTDTIDGLGNLTLNGNPKIATFISDGSTNWMVISKR